LDLKRALLIDFQTVVKDPDLSVTMIEHALRAAAAREFTF